MQLVVLDQLTVSRVLNQKILPSMLRFARVECEADYRAGPPEPDCNGYSGRFSHPQAECSNRKRSAMRMWNGLTPRRCAAALLVIAPVVTLTGFAFGQKPPKADAGSTNSSTMEIAKAEGKLEAQQGQAIKIITAENKDLFLMISQETAIRYSAEADQKWLAPGLMVRFSASFDQGKPTAPLKTLEVFMPLTNVRLNMEQMREQTPGVYQEGKVPPEASKGPINDNAQKPVNGAQPKAAGKATAPKTAQPAITASATGQSFRVVGRLVNLQNNVLTLFAGQPMQLELDPEAAISVSANDMSFAAKGDLVAVSGLRSPAKPEVVKAEKIEIKAAQKLTQAQPVPRGGRMQSGRGKGTAGARNQTDGKAGNVKPGDKAVDAKNGAVDAKKGNVNDKRNSNTKPIGANKPN